jgi:hypothetical protein
MIDLMGAHRSLVSAKEPPLQKRSDPMNSWKVLVGVSWRRGQRRLSEFVVQPFGLEYFQRPGVGRPAVGYEGCARLNSVRDEAGQAQS